LQTEAPYFDAVSALFFLFYNLAKTATRKIESIKPESHKVKKWHLETILPTFSDLSMFAQNDPLRFT